MERVDWERIERSEDFRELVRRRRKFVVPATVFFLVWYLGFIALAGYASDFMGESLYEGFTVGYAIALTQFAMVFGLGIAYSRYSRDRLDPLRARVAEQGGGEDGGGDGRPPDEPRVPPARRFERPPADATKPEVPR